MLDNQAITIGSDRQRLLSEYRRIRNFTMTLVSPLASEDFVIQSMPDVSPPKWHLAHTTWFFETFLLTPHLEHYTSFHPQFRYLFNSYYETLGEYFPRFSRGSLSRPTTEEIVRYRTYVDESMLTLLQESDDKEFANLSPLVEIGLNHEQQHQELILTDVKYNFSVNPLYPKYSTEEEPTVTNVSTMRWISFEESLVEIGNQGHGFSFDNERPRHKTWLNAYQIASRPVTNGEYIEFIEAGGYENPALWLSDGWQHVQEEKWKAPLYWLKDGGRWMNFTLSGVRPVDLTEPVCHISYFEADAFARWAGKRLPTEAEWETAFAETPEGGNFAESERYHPRATTEDTPSHDAFGNVWEWTQSPYAAYPGSKPLLGALGEYNAKFMSGQMVLKGGSCATPESHIRLTYRNFFQPEKRWQFSGFRLAEDT